MGVACPFITLGKDKIIDFMLCDVISLVMVLFLRPIQSANVIVDVVLFTGTIAVDYRSSCMSWGVRAMPRLMSSVGLRISVPSNCKNSWG